MWTFRCLTILEFSGLTFETGSGFETGMFDGNAESLEADEAKMKVFLRLVDLRGNRLGIHRELYYRRRSVACQRRNNFRQSTHFRVNMWSHAAGCDWSLRHG